MKRYLSALKTLTHLLSGVCCVIATQARAEDLRPDITATLEQGPWIDSEPYLNEKAPVFPEVRIGAVSMLREALVKGFRNVDHHNAVLDLHNRFGQRDVEISDGFLYKTILNEKQTANATHGTRWTLFRNAKTYAGKEIKIDTSWIPESVRNGFRFDFSKKGEKKQAPKPLINGVPVRYGLILKDIEPSDEQLALVSAGDLDYRYYETAPKAKLDYEIGPIALNPVTNPYNFSPRPDYVEPEFKWRSVLPDHRFRGTLSPRGLPTPAKPLPDQTLTLQQVQGYYSAEIQFVNGLKKESILHRFTIPLPSDVSFYEEYDEDFKPIKVAVGKRIGNGPFSTNFEHIFIEKRYQAGFFYREGYSLVELYAHLPEAGLEDNWWGQHRWELKVQTAI